MSATPKLLGVVKITISERADWQPPGLSIDGQVEISCEQVASGVAEQDLLGWAYDELSGLVVGANDPASLEEPQEPGLDLRDDGS